MFMIHQRNDIQRVPAHIFQEFFIPSSQSLLKSGSLKQFRNDYSLYGSTRCRPTHCALKSPPAARTFLCNTQDTRSMKLETINLNLFFITVEPSNAFQNSQSQTTITAAHSFFLIFFICIMSFTYL